MNRWCLIILGMAISATGCHAQDVDDMMNGSYDDFRNKSQQQHDTFRKRTHREQIEFRRKQMQEYAEFVRNPWKWFEAEETVPVPKDNQVPPMVSPKDDKKQKEDRPVIIDKVVEPMPVEPQPCPVTPIMEMPVKEVKTVSFSFFGTPAQVRFNISDKISVGKIDANSVADALGKFTAEAYDNVIFDCLKLRDRMGLCDWAYLQMLKALAEKINGGPSNETTLLTAYLYMQSGYRMRLASDEHKLYMLYASEHYIFDSSAFRIDGELYYGMEQLPYRLNICQASFPKERSLSLIVPNLQRFDIDLSPQRTFQSKRYSDVSIKVSVNKNLIQFYNTYPTSMIHDNMMTRWAMYANTPMDGSIPDALYPVLRMKLKDLSQEMAVERLLNMIQTGFEYGFDNEIWGCDRAFFPEETLYYPYCDCEDRSILLSRLVRDLLGLKCILVYYPGHLSMAVGFTEEVKGDYIQLDGSRYVVCDPTYINASVGETMPNMDNSTATVILLE